MSRLDKRRVFAGVVIVALVLQAGFAATAWFGRQHVEDRVTLAGVRRADLSLQLEGCEAPQEPVQPGTKPEWRIGDAPDTSGTLQRIQELGDAGRVELTGLKAGKSDTAGRQWFQITGASDPRRLCEFLARIEREDPLVVVESGRLLPGTEQAVVFDLALATYHTLGDDAGGGEAGR
ncbi:MAG: hypothetical protein NXI31_16360 [bacterium]|nr:hypothetical protein [bacterium]